MICPDCKGSGAVVKWNLTDDSGDGVEICGYCGGHGLVALVEVKNDSVPEVPPTI